MPKSKAKTSKVKKSSSKRKYWITGGAAFLFLAIFVAAYSFFALSDPHKTNSEVLADKTVHIPNYDHIFLILEENHSNSTIIGNPKASFINFLSKEYAFGSNYYAVTHPSVPNYLFLTSASNGGITDDCNPPSDSCNADVANIADRIESSGRSWKAYMENMPGPCELISTDLYDNEHNPFIYYRDILENPARCQAHDVPLTQLDDDLKSADTTPNYSFISPNLCNDMHNCHENIDVGDEWLAALLTKLMDSAAFNDQKTLIVITYDETEITAQKNNVPIILIGSGVKKNYTSNTRYDHFSLLKTIEASWDLKSFNDRDASAKVMSDFFE